MKNIHKNLEDKIYGRLRNQKLDNTFRKITQDEDRNTKTYKYR